MGLVTVNALERVVALTCGSSFGSGFTIDVDGSQYLVTAKHLLPENGEATAVEVVPASGIAVTIPFVSLPLVDGNADVAVTALDAPITNTSHLPLTPSMDGLSLSQDVYFLGFPYGMVNTNTESGRRLAFVKKAALSGSIERSDGRVVVLDGHNNPGFSGGPVVASPEGSASLQVFAVVSGYLPENLPVWVGAGSDEVEGRAEANTGLVIAYEILHVLDAIKNR